MQRKQSAPHPQHARLALVGGGALALPGLGRRPARRSRLLRRQHRLLHARDVTPACTHMCAHMLAARHHVDAETTGAGNEEARMLVTLSGDPERVRPCPGLEASQV